MAKAFKEFLLNEGFRQDALIHSVSSQLGTKTGLHLVFAAFIFGSLSTVASLADAAPWRVWVPGVWVAAMLSLVSIAVLLRCAFLEKYRMPPILPRLKSQAETFFSLNAVKGLGEECKLEEFLEKFSNSLGRSIEDNFNVNARIAVHLERASLLLAVSMALVLASLLYFPVIHAFQFLCHL